jgi:hypothetical protein
VGVGVKVGIGVLVALMVGVRVGVGVAVGVEVHADRNKTASIETKNNQGLFIDYLHQGGILS